MIESFRDKEAEKIINRQFSSKLPQNIQHIARKKLIILDAATELNDLRIPPGNRLEALKGDRKSRHSIRIDEINGGYVLNGWQTTLMMLKLQIIIRRII